MIPDTPLPQRIGPYRVVGRIDTEGSIDILHGREEGARKRDVTLHCVRMAKLEPMRAARLGRQASLCSSLIHPSIARVLGLFFEGERLALAGERVDGPSLKALLPLLDAHEKRLDVAAYVASTLASALAGAHAVSDERGQPTPVVHGTVSPAFVSIARDGSVKLAGFGIATVLGDAAGLVSSVAPEVLKGMPAGTRSDVWSLARLCLRLFGAPDWYANLRPGETPTLESLQEGLPAQLADALHTALREAPEERRITSEALTTVLSEVGSIEQGREALRVLVEHTSEASAAIEKPAIEKPAIEKPVAEIAEAPAPRVATAQTTEGTARSGRTTTEAAPSAARSDEPTAAATRDTSTRNDAAPPASARAPTMLGIGATPPATDPPPSEERAARARIPTMFGVGASAPAPTRSTSRNVAAVDVAPRVPDAHGPKGTERLVAPMLLNARAVASGTSAAAPPAVDTRAGEQANGTGPHDVVVDDLVVAIEKRADVESGAASEPPAAKDATSEVAPPATAESVAANDREGRGESDDDAVAKSHSLPPKHEADPVTARGESEDPAPLSANEELPLTARGESEDPAPLSAKEALPLTARGETDDVALAPPDATSIDATSPPEPSAETAHSDDAARGDDAKREAKPLDANPSPDAPAGAPEPAVLAAEPAIEAEAKPAIEAEAKPAIEAEAKPAIEAEAKPAIEAEAKPAIEADAKPAIEADAKPAIEAEPRPVAPPPPAPPRTHEPSIVIAADEEVPKPPPPPPPPPPAPPVVDSVPSASTPAVASEPARRSRAATFATLALIAAAVFAATAVAISRNRATALEDDAKKAKSNATSASGASTHAPVTPHPPKHAPAPKASASAPKESGFEGPPKPVAPSTKLPSGFGWLLVHSPNPGQVYVGGKPRGEAGKVLAVPCGRFAVTVAKVDAKLVWRGWATKPANAQIACDGSVTELTLAPP